jgi:hypothetical protein
MDIEEPKGINHTLFLFNVKFTLKKTQKGYRGNFAFPNGQMAYPIPIFKGYTFKQSLGRLVQKATHCGLISLEDYNSFIGMSWKIEMDIEVWTKMNKLVKREGKHYFIYKRVESSDLD